jgi:hypothetical protein
VNKYGKFGLNETFWGLKTQLNSDTIVVKKGLFTNGCKKTIKSVQVVEKIILKK